YVALHYLSLLRKDFDKGSRYERLALQLTNNPYTLSVLLSNKGLSHKHKNNHDSALKDLQKALTVLPISFELADTEKNPSAEQLKKLSQKEYAFTPLLDKAEILALDTNNLTYALDTYLLLDTLVDYMRWQHQGMASKLFWRKKLTTLY